MPSGSTHAIITTLAAVSLAGLGYLSKQPEAPTLAVAGGCLVGLILTPDLDLNESTYSYYIMKKETGLIFARLWSLAWFPYSRLIRHRSWVSHFPILSTMIRVGYLAGIAWLILLLLGKPWPWSEAPTWLPWAIVGLMVSDTLHWAADMIVTGMKRNHHRRRGFF
jgi:uncharacterized metal-binding protein